MNFVITGPNTLTASVAKRVAKSGVVGPGGTVVVNAFTQCLTDLFSVSNPDGPSPPSICGTNSNEHSVYTLRMNSSPLARYPKFFSVYVEASDDCNMLNFEFGNMAVGTALANRQFSIKVCHIRHTV